MSVDLLLQRQADSDHPVELLLNRYICPADWLPQPGDDLDIVFESCCTLTECPPDWIPQPGNDLGDLPEAQAHEVQPGNDLDVEIKGACFEVPCPGDWVDQPGNDLDVLIDCCEPGESGEKEPVDLGFARFWEGAEFFGDLMPVRHLPSDAYHGETQFTVFDTYPSIDLGTVALPEGSTLNVDLLRFPQFSINLGHGETNAVTLNTYPSALLEARAFHGETGSAELIRSVLFPLNVWHGEALESDLEDFPNPGTPTDPFVHGETADVELDVIIGFTPRAHHGETADATLGTTVSIPVDMHEGATSFVDLKTAPPIDLVANIHEGAEGKATLNLSYVNIGVTLGAHGETSTAVVSTFPQPNIQTMFYEGASAALTTLSTGINLGNIYSYAGSRMEFDLDSQEFWMMYEGANVRGDLATTSSIDTTFDTGETLELTLKTGPSEPIGVFNAFHGEQHQASFDVLPQVTMRVVFYNSVDVQAGIDATTVFDLDISCCTNHRPPQQDFHRIELNDAEFPGQEFWGDRIRFSVDLAAAPRFAVGFSHGETLRTVEAQIADFAISFAHGEELKQDYEAVVDAELCPGNFIPEGDNVNVELEFGDDTDCESTFAFHGEHAMVGVMEITVGAEAPIHTGSRMEFTLESTSAWVLNAWEGARLFHDAVEPQASEGATLSVNMYRPPYIAGHGESVETALTIKYDVRFTEEGCLENEYIPTDEYGDPIPELFNPVPVEEDNYQHDIQAICE